MTVFVSMADEAEWSDPLCLSIGAIALLVGGYYVFSRPRADLDRLPVVPDGIGVLDFVKQFLGSEGPQITLQFALKIGYVYRIPRLTSPCWVLIGDANLGRQMLEDPRCLKPYPAYELFDKVTGGTTFFSQEGPRANHVRKSTAAAFSPANVKQHMAKIVEEVVEKWIEIRLDPLFVDANKPVDMDEEMMLVTTEVIARAAFDYQLSHEERTEFADKMRQIMQVFFHQGLNPLRKYFGGCFADIRAARRGVMELKTKYGYRFLEACRKNTNPHPNSVVNLMIQDNDYENDEERARDILLYFFGGYETTAHSISFTMLELARYAEEQSKLRSALFATSNKDEDIKLCSHLKNVTKEVLRLHIPVALGPVRFAAEDMPIPNTSRHIPTGSLCSIVLYMIMRNHNVFENPNAFDPSRWENPSEDMKRAYLPFAAGRRNCQGQALASLELNTVVARLIRSYTLEVVDEGKPYYMVALRPKGSKLLLTKLPVDSKANQLSS